MKPCRTLHSIALVTAALTLPGPALGAPGAEDPKTFMESVFDSGTWKDMQADLTLQMFDKYGHERTKELKLWSKKNAGGETSMLMRFIKPADVRGTGFLLVEHKGARDDRRLFLPALRRVKRITGAGGKANFMSSDFTYYDIGKPEIEDWKFSFAGTKDVNGTQCKVVEGVAATEKVVSDTGYSRIKWYVDAERKIVLAADYFDKDGTLFKKMSVLTVENISGRPFATHMRMEDVATGHRSEMVFKNLVTDKGIPDSMFTERSLIKWRR